MFRFLTPYLFWIKLAGVALLMAGSAGFAYRVTHDADTVKYQALQLADSKAQTANVAASLAQLQGFIGSMHAADTSYNTTLGQIQGQFATLKQELFNATRVPLPAECKPDAGRLRVLTDAVSAANASAGVAK